MVRLIRLARATTVALCVGVGGAALAFQAPAEVVSGKVLDGATGRPIQGAVVSLLLSAQQGRFGPPTQGDRSVRTDNNGRFEFVGGLPSGGFSISAQAPGYLPMDQISRESDPRFVPVKIAESVATEGKAVDLVVWPGASVMGVVLDGQGRPAPGLMVRALKEVRVGGRNFWATGATVETNDRGVYTLAPLRDGVYIFAVLALPGANSDSFRGERGRGSVRSPSRSGPDFSLRRYPASPANDGGRQEYSPAFYPTATRLHEATPVRISLGDRLEGVDISLSAAKAFRVSGEVSAVSQLPLDSVIRIVPEGSEDLGYGSEVARTVVQGNKFTFDSIPTGDYTLLLQEGEAELRLWEATAFASKNGAARLPGDRATILSSVLSDTGGTVFARRRPESGPYWIRQSLSVVDKDVVGLTVSLRVGATVRGVLRLAADSQPPRHPTGLFQLEPAAANQLLVMPSVEIDSEAKGWDSPKSFEVKGLTAGTYYFTAGRDVVVESVTRLNRDFTNGALQLEDGDVIDNLIVTLTSRLGAIRGRVVPSRTSPVTVVAFPVGRDLWRLSSLGSGRVRVLPSDHTGSFEISDLPAGGYFLAAVNLDGRLPTSVRDLELLTQRAVRVDVQAGQTVTQDLSYVPRRQ